MRGSASADGPPERPWLPPWWPAPLAGGGALLLYAATLAPGLTWAHEGADGGDFLAAALTAGVPHPSGYPAYQLLLRAAVAVYPGEPARAGNWLSALCAALAVAVFADLARRSLGAVGRTVPSPGIPRLHAVVALVAALSWAASPTLWGQAVITEVYALHALVVVLLLWLLWRWREAIESGTGGWWLAGAGLVLGLGAGNHLSVVLMLPGAAVWLWAGRRKAGGAVAWRWPAVAAAVILGLCTYAYLPLAAAGDPPVNWGDAATPGGFWWLLSGQIYQDYLFQAGPAHWPGRLSRWVEGALTQYGGPWGTLMALAGLWWADRHHHAWWRATGLTALLYSAYALGYGTSDSWVYLIPAWMIAGLWLATGMAWGLAAASDWWRRRTAGRAALGAAAVGKPAGMRRGLGLALLILVLVALLPGAAVLRGWSENDLRADREARVFYETALTEAEPQAVILVSTDRPTFSLWYAVYGLAARPDVAIINDYLYDEFSWYRATLATWHPGLFADSQGSPPVSLVDLASSLAEDRPLYRAESLINVVLEGFAEEPAGVLVRMRSR